jgi:hypothetical protein
MVRTVPGWIPKAGAVIALVLAGPANAAVEFALAPLQRALLAQCTDAGGPGTPCTDATCCLAPYTCDGTQCCSYLSTTCAKDTDCCQFWGPEACSRANGRNLCCSADGGPCYAGYSNICCPGLSCQLDPTSTLGGSTCQGCGLADQATCTKDQECCSGSCKGTPKACCEGLGQQCRDSLDCCGQAGGTGNPVLSCSAPDGYNGRTCCYRIKGTPCSGKADCCSGRCVANHCA